MAHIVALLSGGMDSTALVSLAKHQGAEVTALSFDYGQKHVTELDAARDVARHFGLVHHVVDLSGWGRFAKSVLTQATEGDVPEGHYAADNMNKTVVPFRNPIMLSVAMSLASSIGADAVAAAVHAGDHFVYPDCRPDFVQSFDVMKDYALEGMHTPEIWTPFLNLSKDGIVSGVIAAGVKVPWVLTWSCYKGGVRHCGKCGTCVERAEAFHLAGIPDPTNYEDSEYWKGVVAR